MRPKFCASLNTTMDHALFVTMMVVDDEFMAENTPHALFVAAGLGRHVSVKDGKSVGKRWVGTRFRR